MDVLIIVFVFQLDITDQSLVPFGNLGNEIRRRTGLRHGTGDGDGEKRGTRCGTTQMKGVVQNLAEIRRKASGHKRFGGGFWGTLAREKKNPRQKQEASKKAKKKKKTLNTKTACPRLVGEGKQAQHKKESCFFFV